MGCIEPQDQSGNCPECGMKLIETWTECGLHTDNSDKINMSEQSVLSPK
jgi:hypothetical protein